MNSRRRSIWIAPWDVGGRNADAVLDQLEACGLNAASLALAYHGGRLLLGNHPSRVVYKLHGGGLYFDADLGRFGDLHPVLGREAPAARAFLAAAERRGFAVEAWTVVCHNDYLGSRDPSLCVRNAFGEVYEYALCPANPRVQKYAVELCRQVARVQGVAGLDVEALSFMGYEHASLHDKRGMPLPAGAAGLLSVCLCPHCRVALGTAAEPLERNVHIAVRSVLAGDETCGVPAELEAALLAAVREAAWPRPVNLRLSLDPRFTGGKSTLPAASLAGLADEATVTFFGSTIDAMRAAAARMVSDGVTLRGGLVFHGPDCLQEEDLAARIGALSVPAVRGMSFYSFSLAAPRHLDWLQRALHRGGSI
jgi:hypothetical protein